jgi:hypothetical protein
MKIKEIIEVMPDLAKPLRIFKGKDFRLKDVDPNGASDKARAKQALTNGVTAEVHGKP